MKEATKAKLTALRNYVDGNADTPYEYIIFLVIIINSVSIGLETSKEQTDLSRNILFWIDQICFWIFVGELLFKFIVYNKDFFGEKKLDELGNESFHVNLWNISDLLIVIISCISELPYFAVFRAFRVFRSIKVIKSVRSFRVIRVFKIVNGVARLRATFKGLLLAIPGILWTFCFLTIFTYVYAIIGVNAFGEEFPDYFGSLGHSFLTLCQMLTFDSWISQIARPIIRVYTLSWIYFVSYVFIAAYILMNVIIGVIVDSMESGHQNEINDFDDNYLKELSTQISALKTEVEKLQEKRTISD